MKRAAAVALVLLCCSRQEPALVKPAPVSSPRRVWTAGLLQSGGLRGGMLPVTVRSDGATLRCTPQQQAVVARAVAAAHPEAWKTRYAPPQPAGMTDQFHYDLTLTIDSKEYEVSWDSEGDDLVPRDLRALADALITARGDAGKRCD